MSIGGDKRWGFFRLFWDITRAIVSVIIGFGGFGGQNDLTFAPRSGNRTRDLGFVSEMPQRGARTFARLAT